MVGGGEAGGDADGLGRRAQGGDLDHGLQRSDRRFPEDASIALARRQGVLEEHHVEPAALGDAGGLEIVIEAQQPPWRGGGMAPGRGMVSAGQQPEAEVQLAGPIRLHAKPRRPGRTDCPGG